MGYRRNRAINPVAGITATNWVGAVPSGTVTAARVALGGSGQPLTGVDTVFKATVASGTPAYLQATYGAAGDALVTAGETITVSAYVKGTSAAALTANIFAVFYNASNSIVSTVNGTAVAATSGTWQRVSLSTAVPAGAVRVQVMMRSIAGTTLAVADTAQFSAVLVEGGSTLGAFFLPDVTPGAFWDSASNASTSTLYAFAAPTVTTTDDPPSAHILWTGADLADNVGTITLYRLFDGQTTTQRDAINKFAVGGWVGDDGEIPIGTDVTYRAEVFRTDGQSLGFTPSTTVQIVGENGIGWLSDPLDPVVAPIRITMRDTAAGQLKYDSPGNRYRVGTRTIALLAPRGLLVDLDMSFFTDTADEYQRVLDLADSSNALVLFRVPPPMPIPRLLYCWAKGLTGSDFSLPAGLTDFEWDNVVDQLTAFEGESQSTLTPWQVYIDAFPTWADFNAAYLTWLDAINDPPEA